MAQRITHRRGTATQWSEATYVLAKGEIGIEQDSSGNAVVLKIGNGSDEWDSLPNFVKPLKSVKNKVASYTLSASGDDYILADISVKDITITLPSVEGCKGTDFTIKIIDAGHTLTIQPATDEKIEGQISATITAIYQFVRIISDGVDGWHIVGGSVD